MEIGDLPNWPVWSDSLFMSMLSSDLVAPPTSAETNSILHM